MEQNATSSSKEQGEDMIEETSGYNEQIQMDSHDLRLGSFKMNQTTDPTFLSDPEMTFSAPLSPYECTEKDVDDGALPPQDASTTQHSPKVSEPPHDAQPGPVNSPELNHLFSFASLPYEFTEDFPLVGEVSVISKQGSPGQNLSGASLWPSEPDLAVHTSELAPACACEDVTTDMAVPTQGFLKPNELVFLQTASKTFVEPHQNDLRLQQTSNPISEYPVSSQLLSTLTEWSLEGDLGMCGTVELDSSLSFPSSEPTEEVAMLPVKDNATHSQLGPSELLHPTDMLSANILELLPNSSQSPSLVADWRSDSALAEQEEIKLAKGSPQLPQHQPSDSTQPLYPQSFQFSPSVGDEPLHLLQPPTVSNCQQPFVFPGSNYTQTIPNCSDPGIPPTLYLDTNHKQSEQNRTYFQPSLQSYHFLPYPFMSDKSFNPSGVRYDNQSRLVPWLNLNTISSAPHINSDCSPQFPTHSQINSQQPHPNTGGVFDLSSAGLPPTVERTSKRNHLNPKQYENYRLWQDYCKIAKSFYNSTPDLEALACFFIPVIHSFTLQHSGLPFHIAVEKAILEWKKLSNFDRIAYYQMAFKFMEIEEEKMRAKEEPGTSEELTPRKQIPNQSNTQSARSKGYTKFQSPYKTTKSGGRAKKAKEGSGAVHGGQAVKGKDKNLADEAFREYCEIMNSLESKGRERSDVIAAQEVVNDNVEEGSFTEYLNELCSQKKFVKEVAAEIDMAYISSLLSSDPNIGGVLTPQTPPGNAQEAASSNRSVAETCYVSPQTTAFSPVPPALHPPLQTGGIQWAPPFWPGLYMTGTILPRSSFCKIPIILSQPKDIHASDKHFLGPPQVDAVSYTGVNRLHHQNFVPLNLFQMPPPPTGRLNNLQMSFNSPNATQGKYLIPENCIIPNARNFNIDSAFQPSLSPHNSLFAANGSQNVTCSILPSCNDQMHSPVADCNSQNTLPHQLCQSWNTSESSSVKNEIRRTTTLMNKKRNFHTRSSSHIGQISNDPVTEESILPLNSNTSGQALEKLHRVAMGIELQKDPQSTSHSSDHIQKVSWIRQKSCDRSKKVSLSTVPCAEIISSGYKLKSIKAKKTKKKTNLLGIQTIKESQPDKQKHHRDTEGKSNMGSFLVMKEDVADRKTKAVERVHSMSQTLPDDQDYSITCQARHLQELNEPTEEDLAVAQILSLLSLPSHPSSDSPPSTSHGILSPPIPLFDCPERTTPTEKSQEEEAVGQGRNSLHGPLSLALLSLQALRTSTHGSSKRTTMETEIVRWSLQSPCPFEFSHAHSESKMPQFSWDDNLPALSFLEISESTLSENMDLDGYSKGWSGCTELNMSSSEGVLSCHSDVISDSTEETAVRKKASEDKAKTNGDKTLLGERSRSPATIPQNEVVRLNDITQEGLTKLCDTTELLAIPAQKDAEEKSWTQDLANLLTDSTQSQLSPTWHFSAVFDWLDFDMEFPIVGLDSTSGETDCFLDTLLSVEDGANVISTENMTESTGTNSSKDIISGGTDKHTVRKETEQTDGSVDSKCSLTIEDTTIEEVMDDGSGTKAGESNITQEVHVEGPAFQPGENQETAVEMTHKTTETPLFIEDKEKLVTKPVLLLENEQIASKNFQGSLKNEDAHMRPDHLTKRAGVTEDLTEQMHNMNLEVVSSILGKNVTTSCQIINSCSSTIDSIEERAQNRFVEYQATNEPDIQTKKDVDTTKYQKHEATGSVTWVNEDETGLREMQQTRSCTETLQGDEGERELKTPDRIGHENTANQKRKIMTREENVLEEIQQKKLKREDEKDEEKTKGKEVVYHSVTTRSAREKREMAAGNITTRQTKKLQQLAESQKNETRKTVKSISVRRYEERETETQQQSDGLYRELNAQALNKSLRTVMRTKSPLVLVSSKTRQKGETITKKKQMKDRRPRE